MQRRKGLVKDIQKESVADVELDEEIGGSQTGDEKGEEAMHLSPVEAASKERRRQPTFNFQQLFAMGTEQALQQMSAMHKELTRNHGRRRRRT